MSDADRVGRPDDRIWTPKGVNGAPTLVGLFDVERSEKIRTATMIRDLINPLKLDAGFSNFIRLDTNRQYFIQRLTPQLRTMIEY